MARVALQTIELALPRRAGAVAAEITITPGVPDRRPSPYAFGRVPYRHVHPPYHAEQPEKLELEGEPAPGAPRREAPPLEAPAPRPPTGQPQAISYGQQQTIYLVIDAVSVATNAVHARSSDKIPYPFEIIAAQLNAHRITTTEKSWQWNLFLNTAPPPLISTVTDPYWSDPVIEVESGTINGPNTYLNGVHFGAPLFIGDTNTIPSTAAIVAQPIGARVTRPDQYLTFAIANSDIPKLTITLGMLITIRELIGANVQTVMPRITAPAPAARAVQPGAPKPAAPKPSGTVRRPIYWSSPPRVAGGYQMPAQAFYQQSGSPVEIQYTPTGPGYLTEIYSLPMPREKVSVGIITVPA